MFDYQTKIIYPIVEGESAFESLNETIGMLYIDMPPKLAGKHFTNVTFNIDADGILIVQVTDKETGKAVKTQLETKRGTLAEEEKVQKAKAEALTAFADAMLSAKEMVHKVSDRNELELRRIIAREKQWIKFLGVAPLPQLGIVRTSYLAHAFCLLSVSAVERVFATYYVADYEKKKRYQISIIIIVLLDVTVVLLSYAMVTGVLNAYVICVAVILPNFTFAVMLRLMLSRNRKRLASISHVLRRSANDEYSLSLRVQLKENIWSIQKIEFGMYILIIGLTVIIIITFCPIFVLTEPQEVETLQWWQWVANIFIAVTITLCVPMGTFAIGMQTGELPWYARWYMKIMGSNPIIEVKVEKKETDSYFHQLHSQWDLAMRRATVWNRDKQ